MSKVFLYVLCILLLTGFTVGSTFHKGQHCTCMYVSGSTRMCCEEATGKDDGWCKIEELTQFNIFEDCCQPDPKKKAKDAAKC
jgi:hypothetical protein